MYAHIRASTHTPTSNNKTSEKQIDFQKTILRKTNNFLKKKTTHPPQSSVRYDKTTYYDNDLLPTHVQPFNPNNFFLDQPQPTPKKSLPTK